MSFLKNFFYLLGITYKDKRVLNKLNTLSIEDLISIIESGKYDLETQKKANKTLNKFKRNKVNIKINNYWESYLNENIKSIIISQKIPKSFLLNEQQMKRLIKKARNKLLKKGSHFEDATPTGWNI